MYTATEDVCQTRSISDPLKSISHMVVLVVSWDSAQVGDCTELCDCESTGYDIVDIYDAVNKNARLAFVGSSHRTRSPHSHARTRPRVGCQSCASKAPTRHCLVTACRPLLVTIPEYRHVKVHGACGWVAVRPPTSIIGAYSAHSGAAPSIPGSWTSSRFLW